MMEYVGQIREITLFSRRDPIFISSSIFYSKKHHNFLLVKNLPNFEYPKITKKNYSMTCFDFYATKNSLPYFKI